MRLASIAGTLLVCAISAIHLPALAGSASARRVIGFSPDGAYFAFEEFGRADPGMGQGYVHSHIDVLEVATNSLSKYSVEASQDDDGDLNGIRRKAAGASRHALATYRIGSRGHLIGADRASRSSKTLYYMDVWTLEKATKTTLDVQASELGGKATLVLDYEHPKAGAGDSADVEPSSEHAPTFALTLVRADGRRIVLTKNRLDPHKRDSRDFYKYAIAEAYLLPRNGAPPVIAALVQSFRQGGEGPDRDFIAVAGALPSN